MNRLESVTKPLMLAMALLIAAVVGGCGGQGADPILGGSGLLASGAADTTRPRVVSTTPVNGDTNVPTNRKVTATFSEDMAPASLQGAFTLTCSTPCVSPTGNTVSYAAGSKTATLTPSTVLDPTTQYTATVTTAATDLAGNALAGNQAALPAASNYVWMFTTGATTDTTAPTVTSVNPADLATGVALNSSINARFSEAMDQSTINSTTFTVQTTGTPLGPVLSGSFSYDPQTNIATFTPTSNLAPNTQYTATVTTGATDLAGIALAPGAVPNPWTFTTGGPTTLAPTAVNLGAAASFGIASRAGLTSTGVTVVNGDIALHPTAACTDATGNSGASQTCLVKTYSSPTGMTVNGSIYWAGDPFDNGSTANTVTNDLNTAWTEGQNKVDTQGPIAADEMGGKIFTPGVYHNANLGLMAGGVATLDAQNDANAVFIFKVDSSFVDSGTLLLPSSIVLTNGAQARNVWFVTGLDITIGSGTSWNGNILAGRTATILDGSTVNGRVLAGASGAGAITLTGAASPSVTTITVPQ